MTTGGLPWACMVGGRLHFHSHPWVCHCHRYWLAVLVVAVIVLLAMS